MICKVPISAWPSRSLNKGPALQGLVHYDHDPPEFYEGQTAATSDQHARGQLHERAPASCRLRLHADQLPRA